MLALLVVASVLGATVVLILRFRAFRNDGRPDRSTLLVIFDFPNKID